MIVVMIDGQFVGPDDAKISVLDHGFLFADSVYEVIKTRKGKLFAVEAHLKRMHYSAQRIGMHIGWSDHQLVAEMKRMVDRLAREDCYLRLIITRGEGPLTLCPDGCDQPRRVLLGKPLQVPDATQYRDGISLAVSGVKKWRPVHPNGAIKTGNYLSHVLAIQEARARGCFDALLLNHEGKVAECTTSNIFWVRRKEIYTPALKAGILKGVTRQIVLGLCSKRGLTVHEGEFDLEHLLRADEAFITGTSFDILPVSAVGDVVLSPGQIARALMDDFAAFSPEDLEF